MSEVRIRDNESLESALRRFKRMTARSGVLAEVRKREHYEKPSVKRKKKAEAARKRHGVGGCQIRWNSYSNFVLFKRNQRNRRLPHLCGRG